MKMRSIKINLMLSISLLISIILFFMMDMFVSEDENATPSLPCVVVRRYKTFPSPMFRYMCYWFIGDSIGQWFYSENKSHQQLNFNHKVSLPKVPGFSKTNMLCSYFYVYHSVIMHLFA